MGILKKGQGLAVEVAGAEAEVAEVAGGPASDKAEKVERAK